jgi:hypothetical protein
MTSEVRQLRPVAVKHDQIGDESSHSIFPPPLSGHPGGIALSESEKAEALTDSLEAQFQPVTIPLVPVVSEMVDMALESYFQTPASEPKLTNPDKVLEAIRSLKVGKVPGPNGILSGPEASSHASSIPPRPDLQRSPPHPSRSSSMEACMSDLHP